MSALLDGMWEVGNKVHTIRAEGHPGNFVIPGNDFLWFLLRLYHAVLRKIEIKQN
jgi:hypothetical protein